jgi:hypothetical protein
VKRRSTGRLAQPLARATATPASSTRVTTRLRMSGTTL